MIAGRARELTPSPTSSHDAAAFVAEDRREHALRIVAGQRERVGVADAGRHDVHQHFAGLRSGNVDLFDRQRLAGGESNCSSGLQIGCLPSSYSRKPEDCSPYAIFLSRQIIF